MDGACAAVGILQVVGARRTPERGTSSVERQGRNTHRKQFRRRRVPARERWEPERSGGSPKRERRAGATAPSGARIYFGGVLGL